MDEAVEKRELNEEVGNGNSHVGVCRDIGHSDCIWGCRKLDLLHLSKQIFSFCRLYQLDS